MVFLLGLYGGGSRRRVNGKDSAGRRRSARAPRSVRQLYWKLRSRWRNAASRPRRAGATPRFEYDLHSYSQNFDDGLVSGYRF
ncbi:hypothetical protein GUJ93_ZPchr0012g20492 [Zizania palustris]|uniref:Uncharacterized protein n=1 Tax=Zizania palustris TaxID=103762 RepID=A0A8J6BQ19_ZIZPA|nr:hypothetical protein GUJ93_ZPchr0012g20492 [Zizania palustris]